MWAVPAHGLKILSARPREWADARKNSRKAAIFYCSAPLCNKKTDHEAPVPRPCGATGPDARKNSLRFAAAIFYCSAIKNNLF